MFFKVFEISDLSGFSDAHLNAFGFELNKNDFLAKTGFYFNSHQVIAMIAVDNDVITSYYGVYRYNLRSHDGKIINGVQSGDTLTIKEYQGKGLFVSTAAKVYSKCIEEGIGIVFGIPSEASFYGFKNKLNWVLEQSILRYSCFIPTLPIAIILNRGLAFKFVKYWHNLVLGYFPVGELFNSRRNKNKSVVSVDRTVEFWKTKLGRSNVYLKKIGSCNVVFKIQRGVLLIGDIEYGCQMDLVRALRGIKLLSFLLFCNQVKFFFSDSSDFARNDLFSNHKKGLPLGYKFLNAEESADEFNIDLTYLDFDTF